MFNSKSVSQLFHGCEAAAVGIVIIVAIVVIIVIVVFFHKNVFSSLIAAN